MRMVLLVVGVVVAGVVYHLAQKASAATSPWPMLAVAYGIAFVMTLALASAEGCLPSRGASFAGLLIGLSAFGIEAGFFFIYRAGAPLASVSVIASVAVTAILALIGVFVFREPLTVARAIGLVLAAVAAVLIARG